MYNPEKQEKNLAQLDVKVKQRLRMAIIIAAVAIVLGVMISAELLYRLIEYLQK